MTHMTPEVLKDACKKNGGYAQPLLNDQLFLQCRGFAKIENLEPYTNLKVLWLEQNGIAVIEGLDTCTKLVSLFLQNNAITRITGLTALSNLRILNLSNNYIASLDGLRGACPLLETLQVAHNQLTSLKQCEDLWGLAASLSSVDLSFNKIDRCPEDAPAASKSAEGDTAAAAAAAVPSAPVQDLSIVEFFAKLPNVSVVYLQGNPISHGMRNYRKNMIVHLPQLTYLDERPVFPEERRATEAWGRGGEAAEAEERKRIRQEKRDELSSCVQVMTTAMEANREARDRLTKAWEARREEEREELNARRNELKRQIQGLDAQEFDQRGGIELEESDGWLDLENDLDTLYTAALREEEQRAAIYAKQREIDDIHTQVDRELKAQEERIAAVLESAAASALRAAEAAERSAKTHGEAQERAVEGSTSQSSAPTASAVGEMDASLARTAALEADKSRDTMSYWIRQLDQSDDDVLAQMEEDLQGFLKDLEPGLPRVRAPDASGANPPAAGAQRHAAASATGNAKRTRTVAEAVALTAASLRDQKPASSYSKEALWETYYAWETKQKRSR